MTLIEGHHDARRGRIDIVSDTRVTWTTEPRGEEGRSVHRRTQDVVLKLIVSRSRTRCLGFAGEVDPEEMDDVLIPSYEERETIADEVARLGEIAADGGSDFILATSTDEIWKIAGTSTLTRSGVLAWIGEPDGHQRFRSELASTTKVRIEERLERSMSDVIDSGAVPSVGGMVVRVSTNRDHLFSYFPISGIHIGDGDPRGLAPGGLNAVSMSDSPYLWSALQCADHFPAVGWWHRQTGAGLVSSPLAGTAARRFTAENDVEAAAEAARITGRRMLLDQTFRGRIILG